MYLPYVKLTPALVNSTRAFVAHFETFASLSSKFFSMEVPFVSPCRQFLIVIESDFTDSEFVVGDLNIV